jgi:hypothetical protein
MSTPAFVIRLPIEGRPEVLVDCINESEEKRLLDWLAAHPELLGLVGRALDLQDEARAG